MAYYECCNPQVLFCLQYFLTVDHSTTGTADTILPGFALMEYIKQ